MPFGRCHKVLCGARERSMGERKVRGGRVVAEGHAPGLHPLATTGGHRGHALAATAAREREPGRMRKSK
jgi:hypothetical protein